MRKSNAKSFKIPEIGTFRRYRNLHKV